jgi:transposase
MYDSATVTVGLDVHARSIRLAAVRADELLEERTLPYDEDAVERALRRWLRVRCCYEAGPTGFGLYRHLSERGIECAVVALGLVPQRPGDRVKTDPRDARKLARLLAGGLLEPIHVPSPELEAARDLVRAREDARLDRMRDRHRLSKFCLRHGRLLPGSSWSVSRRIWLSQQRFGVRRRAADLRHLPARGRPRRRPHRGARAGDRRDGRAGAVVGARRPPALPARRGHADRARDRRRDRRLRPLPDGGGVHGLRRPGAFGALLRPAATTGLDHQGRHSHVRRLLVESAWHARRRPKVGYELARR